MECDEVGCENPVEPGHRKCSDCLEYARDIRAHERSQPEPVEMIQTGSNRWTDGVVTYTDADDGEEFNDNDSCLDGRS
jgi:hypothetical protein